MSTTRVEAPPAGSPPTLRRMPGESGAWVFIFADLTVFAAFFLIFLFARIDDPQQWAADQAELNQNFGAINTVVLLVSSLFVVLAVRAVQSGTQRHLAPRYIVAAGVCGLIFFGIKIVEYAQKTDHGITPHTSDFFGFYYMLTGLHAFHLIIGLIVLATMWFFARKPQMTKHQAEFFESGACFWHMVDLLWIVLFPLIFLVR